MTLACNDNLYGSIRSCFLGIINLSSAESAHSVISVKYLYIRTSTVELYKPASMAQLDASPTGDQEVAGSAPDNIALWRFEHEIFSTIILSLPLIQEGQLSVSGEIMCTILVNRLED